MNGPRPGVRLILFTLVAQLKAEGTPGDSILCTQCDRSPVCHSRGNYPCGNGYPCSNETWKICQERYEEKTCDTIGIFPSNTSREHYYECQLNNETFKILKIEKGCPPHTEFSVSTLRCLTHGESDLVELRKRKTAGSSYECFKPGIYPNSDNCKKYYICESGDVFGKEITCPPKTYFSAKEGLCTNDFSKKCAFELQNEFEKELREADEFYKEVMRGNRLNTLNTSDKSQRKKSTDYGSFIFLPFRELFNDIEPISRLKLDPKNDSEGGDSNSLTGMFLRPSLTQFDVAPYEAADVWDTPFEFLTDDPFDPNNDGPVDPDATSTSVPSSTVASSTSSTSTPFSNIPFTTLPNFAPDPVDPGDPTTGSPSSSSTVTTSTTPSTTTTTTTSPTLEPVFPTSPNSSISYSFTVDPTFRPVSYNSFLTSLPTTEKPGFTVTNHPFFVMASRYNTSQTFKPFRYPQPFAFQRETFNTVAPNVDPPYPSPVPPSPPPHPYPPPSPPPHPYPPPSPPPTPSPLPTPSTPVPPPFDCLYPGFFRDPTDCHNYYHCFYYVDTLYYTYHTCGRREWFSNYFQECIKFKPYKCWWD